jgi:hypothetical protein
MQEIDGILETWIARMRALEGFAEAEIVEIFAEEGQRMVADSVAQQADPHGNPWPASVTGREAMLTHAVSELQVTRTKTGKVFLRFKGRYANHNFGAVRGGRKRGILPPRSAPLPDVLRKRVIARLFERFQEIMHGERTPNSVRAA